jgi:peroxiredoxin
MSRIQDFLSLFYVGSPTDTILPREEYHNAIDIIMTNVSADTELRQYVVDLLLDIFERDENEQALNYIVENYLEEQCESDVADLVLSRMNGFKKMEKGVVAPEIVIKDRNGRTISMSELDEKYVLVMFWASTCEHCQKLIPKLHDWYLSEEHPELEVLSVSIDTIREQWESYIEEHELKWICAWEPLGWYGKVAGDYYVYATPSIFLLDRNRLILDKPISYRQIIRTLKGME